MKNLSQSAWLLPFLVGVSALSGAALIIFIPHYNGSGKPPLAILVLLGLISLSAGLTARQLRQRNNRSM